MRPQSVWHGRSESVHNLWAFRLLTYYSAGDLRRKNITLTHRGNQRCMPCLTCSLPWGFCGIESQFSLAYLWQLQLCITVVDPENYHLSFGLLRRKLRRQVQRASTLFTQINRLLTQKMLPSLFIYNAHPLFKLYQSNFTNHGSLSFTTCSALGCIS